MASFKFYVPFNWLRSAIFLLLLLLSGVSLGNVEHHTKLWNTAVFVGPLFKNSKIKYYFEPQLRFIDNRYKFEEAFIFLGIGYQTTSDLTLFLGGAEVISKRSTGENVYENRIWQQANWDVVKRKSFNLLSRTRLEERKRNSESQWAVRLRERMMARIPLKNCEKHSLVLFDEVFFNINHPRWVSNKFFSQNRAFFGIGTKISEQISFDIGYLNQYIFANPDQMNNILLLSLNIAYD